MLPVSSFASLAQEVDGSDGFGVFSSVSAPGTTDSNRGSFIGSSDVGSQSWGFYASNSNISEAFFDIGGGALSVGQTISFRMDNGSINTGGSIGWGLQNAANNNNRFEFYFTGGDSTYRYQDSAGSAESAGIGFTSGGIDFAFTLTGTNTYSIDVQPIGSSVSNFTGTLTGTSDSGVDRLRFFNYNAGSGSGHDLFLNSISVIPEPSSGMVLSFLLSSALILRRKRTA